MEMAPSLGERSEHATYQDTLPGLQGGQETAFGPRFSGPITLPEPLS